MTRKLELKDICGYFPYGLKLKGGDHICPLANNLNINPFNSTISVYSELIPILLPLCDLYRNITHNGKEIIPIVDSAKKINPKVDWFLSENAFGEPIAKSEYSALGFFDKGFIYYFDNKIKQIENQIKLFDYLNELKIDYRGLIDAGLAVSCYDLDENPYK